MGGHVDDFHTRAQVRRLIETAYQWGTMKQGSYRHAGPDVRQGWQLQDCGRPEQLGD